jgi:hypothetical protein
MHTDTYNPAAFAGRTSTARTLVAPQTANVVADVLCFLIPFLSIWNIRLIGELPIGEILILLMVPVCLINYNRRIWNDTTHGIYIMMGFWFLAQFVSDLYNNSKHQNMAKGLASIAFFALDLAVLTALINNNPRRILAFALGICPMHILTYMLTPELWSQPTDVVWKTAWGPFVNSATLLVCCYFTWHKRYTLVIFAVGGLITINLLQNFRSAALVLTLTLVLSIPLPVTSQQKRIDRKGRRPFDSRILIMVFLGLIGMTAIAMTYSYTASMGMLGEVAQAKYESQSRGKFGVLIGGRPETLVSLRAVAESPIIGHGSWAEDPKYPQMLMDELWEGGYAMSASDLPSVDDSAFLIPTHSHIFGAWVWSGILGLAFWVYFLIVVGRGLAALIRVRPWLGPYLAYMLSLAFWDVFFSPFASTRRITVSFLLASVIYLFNEDKKQTETLRRAFLLTQRKNLYASK